MPPSLRLHEEVFRVFPGAVLGVGLLVVMEILAVLLLDSFHLLVPVCFFPSVEDSGGYSQDGENHEDDDGYDTCGGEDVHTDTFTCFRRMESFMFRLKL